MLMRNALKRSRSLLLVLIPFIVLGVIYSLVTPPLEASDEFKHYPFTQYVQTERKLPVLDPPICLKSFAPDECPWLQDGGQPPLYYMAMALLTSWIDTDDLSELRWVNEHAYIGDPSQIGNKSLHIHQPEREAFPWRGSVLAIHLIRLLSIGLGAITVTLTYQVSLELFPEKHVLALSAAAMTAFTPMFLFVSGSVNNDTFSATAGNLALLLLIRLAKRWTSQRVSEPRFTLHVSLAPAAERSGIRFTDILPLSLTIGLYLLGKLSALGFIALTGVVLAWVSWRRRDWRPLVVGGATVVGAAALVAGWWFARNYDLYGDLTALNYFVEIQGWRTAPLGLHDVIDEFGTFRWTFWGLFGAVNVMAPRWVYTFFDLLSIAGLTGLFLRAWRKRRTDLPWTRQLVEALTHLWWIPALWVSILFISLVRWTIIFYSFQGRLMFPGIAGISTLLMLGLREWAPARYRNAVGAGVGLLMFGISAMLPFVSIMPAYVLPEPLTLAQVPESALRPPVDFTPPDAAEPLIRLVGYEVPPGQTVRPNELVKLTLYWQLLRPTDDDFLSYVKLWGRNLEPVAQVNRFPGMGMVPTSLWEPGQVWRDDYGVRMGKETKGPLRLLIDVGLYDKARQAGLSAIDSNGDEIGRVIVGQAKLGGAGPKTVEPTAQLDATFADGVGLTGADIKPLAVRPGEVVSLTLYWAADRTPAQDYTIFVHLLGDGPQPVAQVDGPPDGGHYPTHLWAKGETIVDRHEMIVPENLPPGDYRLVVGMYLLTTGERLPLLDESEVVIGDHVELGVLRVQ